MNTYKFGDFTVELYQKEFENKIRGESVSKKEYEDLYGVNPFFAR